MKAIILLGLPLAGKSTWVQNFTDLSNKQWTVVSADVIKETIPGYKPELAHMVHQQSVKMAEEMMYIEAKKGVNLIMDGGGINNSYTKRIIHELKALGYHITMVHINTPYEVCIERGQQRERKVPIEEIQIKAVKEHNQFYELSELVDEVNVVDYFSNKHIFVDMDGVIAEHPVIPKYNGKLDFVNRKLFTYLKPVIPVMEKFEWLNNHGYTLYILSGIPNHFSYLEKNAWLDEHFPIVPQERRFFVNSGRHKAEMLRDLTIKLKLQNKDVTLVDDTHTILEQVRGYKFNPMHPSQFLTKQFESLL